MRFPQWAVQDQASRFDYMYQVMAAWATSEMTVKALNSLAGINQSSYSSARNVKRMSPAMAEKVTEAAKGSGVNAFWMVAPELMKFSPEGDVL